MQEHAVVDVCIDVSYDAVFTAKKVAPMVASKKVLPTCTGRFRMLTDPPHLDREQHHEMESSSRRIERWS